MGVAAATPYQGYDYGKLRARDDTGDRGGLKIQTNSTVVFGRDNAGGRVKGCNIFDTRMSPDCNLYFFAG